jgi:hypothetical protein
LATAAGALLRGLLVLPLLALGLALLLTALVPGLFVGIILLALGLSPLLFAALALLLTLDVEMKGGEKTPQGS